MTRRPSDTNGHLQERQGSCSTSSNCPAGWVAAKIAQFGALMPEKAAECLQRDFLGLSAPVRRLYVPLNEAPDIALVLTSEICWRLLAQQRRSHTRCKPVITTRREDPHPAKPV